VLLTKYGPYVNMEKGQFEATVIDSLGKNIKDIFYFNGRFF